MAEPFMGEIRMFSFNFAPVNWATCDGQVMSINQFQALYSLLGTTYGGDGVSNFRLPDLRGRTMLHKGGSYAQGQMSGFEQSSLGTANLPVHAHMLSANSGAATVNTPQGNALAASETAYPNYSDLTSQAILDQASLALAGGGQSHDNMQPSLVINFCIALLGVYPPRS